MKPYTLVSAQRIKSARDFARIYSRKLRAADGHLLIYGAENGSAHTRFGLSVSRKVGMAVKRSAVKRLLREAFRLSQHDLPPGLDLILIPQRKSVETAKLADYRRSLVDLARRLRRRIAVPSSESTP